MRGEPIGSKVYRAALERARRDKRDDRIARLAGAQVVSVPIAAVEGQCYDPPAYDLLRQPWKKMFAAADDWSIGTLGVEHSAADMRMSIRGTPEETNQQLVNLLWRVSNLYVLYTFVGTDPATLIASTFVGVDSSWRPDPVFISATDEVWQSERGKQYLNAGIGLWSFTVSLLNCSNIATVNRTFARPRRTDGRERPAVEWKDVVVRVGRTATRALSAGDGSEAVRLHAVRGHFKTFDAHALFGKVKGRYWWEQHVRGDAARGVIMHDTYKVGRERP